MRSAPRLAIVLSLTCLCAAGVFAQPCTPVTAQLAPAYNVTTWPPAPFRWSDIAVNVYAQTYRDTYTYDDAFVTVTYAPCEGLTFAGHLSASNLKPNFAYQIKLVGKPTGLWAADGDDAANELIGFIGRWWRTQPNPGNSSDADYLANHENPDYIFEGYLLLEFFITDRFGGAEVDFAVDSSYHVLFWEHQRTPGVCDSPVKWSTVIGGADDPAYDADVGPTEIGVYAEIERGCTGTTTMTLGNYNCRLLLTEESFHQSGDIYGYWASAMSYDGLSFTIVDDMTAAPAGVLPARLLANRPNPFNPATEIRFELAARGPVLLTVHDAAGRLVRTLARGEWSAGEHEVTWRGCDDGGQPVASGNYLVRLRAAAVEQTRAVTLLK